MTRVECDYLIVGGGIAGASVGYWLSPHGRVLVLDMESQPGYHATGRSAAIVIRSYGTATVRALTDASLRFFENPPPNFTDGPLLSRRGSLVIGRSGDDALLSEHWDTVRSVSPQARLLDAADAHGLIPVLRTADILRGVFEPDVADIDVHALHQGFLRGIRRNGGKLVCNSQVDRIERSNGGWTVEANATRYRASVLVNAAGAWCDEIAQLAGVRRIGLVPKRRSAFTFAPPPGVAIDDWPHCAAVDKSWYMKPEAGLLLGSPANADPAEPHDVQPEEMDIALGIYAIESMTSMEISRPFRAWAGLRSFVADENPVGGFDPEIPGFFWVAGQGGFGVQTSAAMGESCASLIRGAGISDQVASRGVTEGTLSPARLRVGAQAID